MSLIILTQDYEDIWTLDNPNIWYQQHDENKHFIACTEGKIAEYRSEKIAKCVLSSIFDLINNQVEHSQLDFIVSVPRIQMDKTREEYEASFIRIGLEKYFKY